MTTVPTIRRWRGPSALDRQAILRRTRTVAVVGASDNPARASYFVATYLLASTSYQVWFVNPRATTILDRPVYPSLADLPGVPDLVDVFRRPADLPAVLDETLAIAAPTIGVPTISAPPPSTQQERSPVLWLQLGLWDEEVATRGEAAGLTVVMDRCVKIEHARFHGGLHLAGFNTGVITSRRRRD